MTSTGGLTGQTLGQYELRELLGRGGMGAVYRAYQHSLKREVAVKVLSDMLTDEPGYIERFNAEARTAAALEHPHIVPIHDFGMQNDVSYVVMRFLTGGSLHERMRAAAEQGRGTPSMAEISELLAQVASALDYAHHEGVVHRDIKPQNIMFDNHGKAYVVDFGIAKLLHQTAMTMSGMALGSPSYMPPEQWRGEGVTGAADQYALAVTIYALVAGRLPFEGDSQQQLMYKHLSEMPPALSGSRPDLPPALTLVLNRALAKEAGERFPNCTQFAQAFRSAIEGVPGEATNYFSFKLPKQERKPSTVTARPPDSPQPTPQSTPQAAPATSGAMTNAATTPAPLSKTLPPPPPAPKRAGNRSFLIPAVAFAVVAIAALFVIFGSRGDLPAANATETAIAALVERATDTPTTEASSTTEPTQTSEAAGAATATDAPTNAPTGEPTDEPTEEPTMDALAIAQATRGVLQTANAATQQAAAFQATVDALQTSLFLEDMTATATLWTPSPEPTDTIAPSETTAPTDMPEPTETTAPTDTPTVEPVTVAFGMSIDGLTVQFENETDAAAISFLWLFGDGTSSTERNPEHTYSESGTYTVRLVAGSLGGEASAERQITVVASATRTPLATRERTLLPFHQTATAAVLAPTATRTLIPFNATASAEAAPAAVTAAFNVNQDGLRAVFVNRSTGQLASILWEFGDGETSTLRSPFHDYAEPGSYVVTLNIVDALGNTSQTQQTITLRPRATPTQIPFNATATADALGTETAVSSDQPPLPSFGYSGADNRTVIFTNETTGSALSFLWDFGDGTTSTLRNPEHAYAESGVYTVTLTAGNLNGQETVEQQVPVIILSVGTASFGWTNNGLDVQFENASGDDALTFLWDFGDGSNPSTVRSPEHTYAEGGMYVVTLTAGTLGGQSVAEQVIVIADVPPPDVDAYYVQTGPTTAAFMFSSSGDVSYVLWHFGDGEHSEDFIAIHDYAEMGSYEVELEATGPGGSTTVTEAVTLTEGCVIEPDGGDVDVLRAAPSPDAPEVATHSDEVYTAWAGRDESGGIWYHVFHENVIAWVSADDVNVVEGDCPVPGE